MLRKPEAAPSGKTVLTQDDKLILSKRLLDIEELLDHKKFIRREVESRYEQTKQASHQAEQLLKKMRYVS